MILLLDDIVAHLDAERRLALFAETAKLAGQVWFSGIDHASFAPSPAMPRWFILNTAGKCEV